MDTEKMGLMISGIVAAKNTYVSKANGEQRFSVDIAVPGNRQNVSVGVPREYYDRLKEFSPFQGKLSMAVISGNYIFSVRV